MINKQLEERIKIIFKIWYCGYNKLNKKEKRLAGIMNAENKEYQVWHQGPELAE